MEAAKGKGNSGKVECTFVYQTCLQFSYIQSSGLLWKSFFAYKFLFSFRYIYLMQEFVIIPSLNFRYNCKIERNSYKIMTREETVLNLEFLMEKK